MKKSYLFLATLLVGAVVSVAVVSCKKETANDFKGNKNETMQAFNPQKIEDMNTYLKDFKQKIQSAAKGDDEALSLEDAAWHLSSLANFEFANANVECDDVRFDTLYAQVNVTNGTVLLSDLATAYENISTCIDKFYHGLTLDNKHFRFINAIISENGDIAIPILTTFSNGSKDITDHIWYFPDDVWVLCDTCYYYLNASTYPAQTTGTTELQRVLNLIVSHPLGGNGIVYFTSTFTKLFDYLHYFDPYGSPSYNDSRVFASINTINTDMEPMVCYFLDSYLGLGHQYLPTDEYILCWEVEHHYRKQTNGLCALEYQNLYVTYGEAHEIPPVPGHNDQN